MTALAPVATATAGGSGIPLTWLLLRTTGVITLALLTVSVVIGIAGPVVRRPSARLSMIAVHSAAAVTGLVLLVGHIVFAVADSFVEIGPLAAVVPGVSVWAPLWVGLGTAAADLLAVIAITTALRLRAPLLWRRAHLLSYPAWLLAWGHALTAGTDATSRPMLLLAVVSFAAVGAATLVRLLRPDVTRLGRGLAGPAAATGTPRGVGGPPPLASLAGGTPSTPLGERVLGERAVRGPSTPLGERVVGERVLGERAVRGPSTPLGERAVGERVVGERAGAR